MSVDDPRWSRADEWASAQLDSDLSSSQVRPRARVDESSWSEDELRRIADLQLLDALLASRRPSRQRAVERALAATLNRLQNEIPATQAAAASAVQPTLRPSTDWRRRTGLWLGAAAAVALLAIVGWNYDRSRAAYAMVSRLERQAAESTDRTYRVTIESAVPLAPRREAKFYVRGGRQFVYDDPGLLGVRLRFGCDGQRRWHMTPAGPAFLPPSWTQAAPVENWSSPVRRAADAPAADAPYLQISTLLGRLRERYSLQRLPSVALPSSGDGTEARRFDRLSARLTERTSELSPVWPESVEVWASPTDGIVERLELRWPAGGLPAGPRSLVFELESQTPLGERFFEADTHGESGS